MHFEPVAEQPSESDQSMASNVKLHLVGEKAIILKEWSAQDFANTYVRVRPHLISHAQRYLRDATQAEEVVQDAFLYLMTALPELDSELGVLRFLKWKTKMLCLDILRTHQAGHNLLPLTDDLADETQPLDSLERADDAAIISLALAKLNPRHREALIATLYEEKSHEEVARQLGLSENGLRQLLFRARASFRKALVGEAQVEGKSVAEILSVAARRAASFRNAVILTLLITTTAAVSPMLGVNTEVAGHGEGFIASTTVVPDLLAPETAGSVQDSAEEAPSTDVLNLEPTALAPVESGDDEEPIPSSSLKGELASELGNTEEVEAAQAREAFNGALDENLVIALASEGLRVSESGGQLIATNDSGLTANFAVDLNSQKVVQFLVIEFESSGQVWKAVPNNSLSVVEEIGGLTSVSYAATDFLVGDFSGEFDYVSTSESVFSRSGIKLDLLLNEKGELVGAHVSFLPKT